MEQQIQEIISKIDAVEKVINVIQQNLNSNIQAFLSCLALIVATSGVALVYYVKSTVNKRVEKELLVIRENLKNELKGEIEGNVKKYIKENRQIKWAKGSKIITEHDNIINICGLDINKENLSLIPLKCEIFLKTHSGGKYTTEAYSYNISSDGILSMKFDEVMNIQGNTLNWEITWIEILEG